MEKEITLAIPVDQLTDESKILSQTTMLNVMKTREGFFYFKSGYHYSAIEGNPYRPLKSFATLPTTKTEAHLFVQLGKVAKIRTP